MRFGKIELNPARNPAILDTALWDAAGAWRHVTAAEPSLWQAIAEAGLAGRPLPAWPQGQPHAGSFAPWRDGCFFLASLSDGQQVFLEVNAGSADAPLGAPLASLDLAADRQLRMVATSAVNLDRYCQLLRPDKGPRALGAIPRLGCGSRMTTAVWPALYASMDAFGFAANSIQNSVRELNLLDNVLQARSSEAIYYPGFGNVAAGHTGSTFEGLWTYGVLEALRSDGLPRYGADADHLKIRRGRDGLASAIAVMSAAPYYTFYTIDVSEALDYRALTASPAAAADLLNRRIPLAGERRAVLAYHLHRRRIAGRAYALSADDAARLIGKYWDALDAMQALGAYLTQRKAGRPYDLEFAIDERPPDIGPYESITTEDELAFVALEIARRRLPVTHIAPNLGVEKGVDYRVPGGLPGLEKRLRAMHQIVTEFGLLLDIHSGDDLSAATRQVIGRATAGRHHFKVSPTPQLMFAQTLHELQPDAFADWYAGALAYAQAEADAGSQFAAECLQARHPDAPGAEDSVFHNFGFDYVGKRGPAGDYLHREALYSLPASFYAEYQRRLVSYFDELARDLFAPGWA